MAISEGLLGRIADFGGETADKIARGWGVRTPEERQASQLRDLQIQTAELDLEKGTFELEEARKASDALEKQRDILRKYTEEYSKKKGVSGKSETDITTKEDKEVGNVTASSDFFSGLADAYSRSGDLDEAMKYQKHAATMITSEISMSREDREKYQAVRDEIGGAMLEVASFGEKGDIKNAIASYASNYQKVMTKYGDALKDADVPTPEEFASNPQQGLAVLNAELSKYKVAKDYFNRQNKLEVANITKPTGTTSTTMPPKEAKRYIKITLKDHPKLKETVYRDMFGQEMSPADVSKLETRIQSEALRRIRESGGKYKSYDDHALVIDEVIEEFSGYIKENPDSGAGAFDYVFEPPEKATEQSKTINGVTYIKRGDKWYSK